MPRSLTRTRPNTTTTTEDARPRFGIGHLSLTAADVSSLTELYGRLGMRIVVHSPGFSILELRGGTHLILQPGPAGVSSLDLIVGDIDDAHDAFVDAGLRPTSIVRGVPHDRFKVTDSEGTVLMINSDHSIGVV